MTRTVFRLFFYALAMIYIIATWSGVFYLAHRVLKWMCA